jgi:hypothetical protein
MNVDLTCNLDMQVIPNPQSFKTCVDEALPAIPRRIDAHPVHSSEAILGMLLGRDGKNRLDIAG